MSRYTVVTAKLKDEMRSAVVRAMPHSVGAANAQHGRDGGGIWSGFASVVSWQLG